MASATKLMTAHVALQRLPRSRRIRAPFYSALPGESLLGLAQGDRISIGDAVYALILESANDAAFAIALHIGGSQERFARQMNLSAAALGLVDSHFANPIGLDEPGNYSSAQDLAVLARRLMQRPFFRRVADSTGARLRSMHPPLRIGTRNTLLFRAPWVTGIKTGHTLGAGYVLVASGRRQGVELISVVLGAPSELQRDLESLELLQYGFSLYRKRTPVRRGEELASPSIRYAGGELPLRAARSLTAGFRRGQRLDVEVRAPEEVEGPIRRGTPLGTVTVTVDGRRSASAPLLVSRSIPEAGEVDKARAFVRENPVWPVVAGFVILIAVVALTRWRRAGRRRAATDRGPSEEEMRADREQRRRTRQQRRRGEGGGTE